MSNKAESMLERIYAMLGKSTEVELASTTIEDGAVTLESENFAEGEAVWIITKSESGETERMPLPEGTYMLADGATIVVDDKGVIMTRTEKGEEAVVETEQAAPETQTQTAKKIIETNSTTKETMFSKEEIKAFEAKFAEGSLGEADLSKVVKFLFNDRFKWEIEETERAAKMGEMKTIAANLEKVELSVTDKDKEIEELTEANVKLSSELDEVKAKMETEAAPSSTHSPENTTDNNMKVHFGSMGKLSINERVAQVLNN